ncbi:MAG: hypothetical protein HC906_04175 [Bacteroidales bacterium]|nr:hypothetical protein [Bacteroidales bacterium]
MEFNRYIESYKIQKPRGVVLSKITRQDYETYLNEIENISASEFTPQLDRIDNIFNEYGAKLEGEIIRRKRLEIAIESTIELYKKTTKSDVAEIQDIAKK